MDAVNVLPERYNNSKMMFDDFRAVFMGSEQGKRVFHQIMSWAGMFRSSIVKNDPYAVHVREGERNIGARLWLAVITEPKERPTETVKRRL